MVGPCNAGKTRLANQMLGMDVPSHDPTKGVRILEIDCDINLNRQDLEVNMELWDVSGNSEYDACYQAVCQKLQGLIVVYNPDAGQANEVAVWLSWFCTQANLKADQVLVLAHSDNEEKRPHISLDLKNGTAPMQIPVQNVTYSLPPENQDPSRNASWVVNRVRPLVKRVYNRFQDEEDDDDAM
jgi:GTPase SAR1 family protein